MTSRARRAALALALVALAAAGPARAADGAGLIATFDRIRVENGLPGGLVEVPEWSQACALHNRYRLLTGRIGHFEEPGQPGYTPEGDDAARASVLSPAPSAPGEVPFLEAPYHLAALLMPQVSHTGAAQNDGHVCIRTVRGTHRRSAASDQLLVYPGDGRAGVPPQDEARELPSTPGQEVGIPQGTPTGPHLLLFADGPWATSSFGGIGADGLWSFGGRRVEVTRARLEGPGGEVPLVAVDGRHPTARSLVPTTGILIPKTPLAPGASYRATATLASLPAGPGDTRPATELTRTWWFATADGSRAPSVARLAISLDRAVRPAGSRALAVRVRVNGVQQGARPVLTAAGRAVPVRPLPGAVLSRRVVLRDGRHAVCIATDGGGAGAAPARICDEVEVGARPMTGLRRAGPRRLEATLDPRAGRLHGVLLRESARRVCGPRRCRTAWRTTSRRAVSLRPPVAALAASPGRPGVRWRLVARPAAGGPVAWRAVSLAVR